MQPRSQLLVACFALTSCVVGCADVKEREAGERALDHHFDALKRRTFETALSHYDSSFYSDVTRAEWRAALSSVADKLGTFQSYEINSSGLAYKQVAGPGSYLRFQVTTTYSKHTADETLYLFRKPNAKHYKIVGHQIDSPGLKK